MAIILQLQKDKMRDNNKVGMSDIIKFYKAFTLIFLVVKNGFKLCFAFN